jgi:signal transduction histidine kinase
MDKTVVESSLAPSPQLLQMVTRTLRHEVGDLLQTIYSVIAILRGRLPAASEMEHRLLKELHTQAEMCKFKLDAVQDLTCPLSLNCGPTNLADIILGLTARIGPRFPQIQLVVDAPRSLPIVVDGQRLGQVGHLLLVNACQAAQQTVRVHLASREEGRVEWSICDDGSGANPEQLSWLTKPFSTAHFAQFGLGVALARRVVDLHGGAVTVTTPPEGGFCIVLRLPTSPARQDRECSKTDVIP